MTTTVGATELWGDTSSASERVLDAVATEEGCSPLDFDRPLNDVIDPDALDAIFREDAPTASVAFPYLGYRVVVRGDGQVTVDA